MTLDQIRIFIAVAELQHVTRAAANLHLTQSSVSSAIAALEARHGVGLFHRVGRRIELTVEGRLFLQSAKALLAQAQNAEMMLADLGGLRRGLLTVFASQTIANFWLPARIVAYSERYPLVGLSVQIGNTYESMIAVSEGRAEIGLIEGEGEESSLAIDLVAQDRLVLVVGRGHDWAKQTPRLPDELDKTSWAIREKGSGTRSSFEQALTGIGMSIGDLSIAMELPSNEALCAAVSAGHLATVVSTSVAQAGINTGSLVAMPLDLGEREFRLVHHRERNLSRAASAFVDLILEGRN